MRGCEWWGRGVKRKGSSRLYYGGGLTEEFWKGRIESFSLSSRSHGQRGTIHTIGRTMLKIIFLWLFGISKYGRSDIIDSVMC